jgi:hypothetical protein
MRVPLISFTHGNTQKSQPAARNLLTDLHPSSLLPSQPRQLTSSFIQSGVKREEWPKYLKEVYRILKPGGYAQISELDSHLISETDSMPAEAPINEVLPDTGSYFVFSIFAVSIVYLTLTLQIKLCTQ